MCAILRNAQHIVSYLNDEYKILEMEDIMDTAVKTNVIKAVTGRKSYLI